MTNHSPPTIVGKNLDNVNAIGGGAPAGSAISSGEAQIV